MNEFKNFLIASGKSENTVKSYTSDVSIYERDKENYLNPEKFKLSTLERRKNSLNCYFKFLKLENLITKKFNKTILFQKDCIENELVKKIFDTLDELLKEKKSFKDKKIILQRRVSISLGINEGLRVCEYKNLEFEKTEIEIKDSKHNGFRTIPLTDDTLEKVNDLYNFLGKPKGFVFQKNNKQFISIRTFQLWLSKTAEAAGVPKGFKNTHGLRHRFARNYLKVNDGKLEQLKNIMGHKSIQTTLMYVLPSKSEIQSGMNKSSISNF